MPHEFTSNGSVLVFTKYTISAMSRTLHIRWLLFFFVAVLSTSCNRPPAADAPRREGPLVVIAVNEPLRFFAERIGGKAVVASCPCPSDSDPALWTPDSQALEAFQSADLILLNGADYARWTTVTSLPDSKLVNTSRGFQSDWLTMEEAIRHRHGPEGEHSHESTIGEVWLDPQLAIKQAERIERMLSSLEPSGSVQFARNLLQLKEELLKLRADLRAAVSARPTMLFAADPAFEYIARTVGQSLYRVTWNNLQQPSPVELDDLKKAVKDHPNGLFLLSSPPTRELKQAFDDASIDFVVFDTAATTREKSYLERMSENVQRLEQLLE